jgi:hypothetical protein
MRSRTKESIGALVSNTVSPNVSIVDIFQGCNVCAHGRCASQICVVCPTAFRPDQVRVAFVRCFASLLYTYRRYLHPATGDQKKSGLIYRFNMDGFLGSMPRENAEYMSMLHQTQGESHQMLVV